MVENAYETIEYAKGIGDPFLLRRTADFYDIPIDYRTIKSAYKKRIKENSKEIAPIIKDGVENQNILEKGRYIVNTLYQIKNDCEESDLLFPQSLKPIMKKRIKSGYKESEKELFSLVDQGNVLDVVDKQPIVSDYSDLLDRFFEYSRKDLFVKSLKNKF